MASYQRNGARKAHKKKHAEKHKAIVRKVDKLKQKGIIQSIHYHYEEM